MPPSNKIRLCDARVDIEMARASESIFEKIPSTGHVEPASETNADEFENVVRSRRSTRVY